MPEENKEIETDKEKRRSKSRIFALCFFILLFFILIFYYAYMNFNKNNIPEDGKFVENCKSSKYYAPGGGIFAIGNDKYFILGASNKLDSNYWTIPMKEPIIHFEIYNAKIKKIKQISPSLIYLIFKSVQITNGNIFLLASDAQISPYKRYFAAINIKNFTVKKIADISDIYPYEYSDINIYSLYNNKVLVCISSANNTDTAIFIYDANLDKFYQKFILHKYINTISAIELNKEEVLFLGCSLDNHKQNTDRYSKTITICNFSTNICTEKKAVLSEKKINPKLFKINNHKILVIGDEIGKLQTIELYDIENDSISTIGIMPNDRVYSRKYTQLKNGNILIIGGVQGIMNQKAVKDSYIFDTEKFELRTIKNGTNYIRLQPLTKVLNDGNVLICGILNNECELYITKEKSRQVGF